MITEPPYYSHPNSELSIDVSESPNEEGESPNEEDDSSNEEDPPHPHSCTCQPEYVLSDKFLLLIFSILSYFLILL